jgi:hypothetical protein
MIKHNICGNAAMGLGLVDKNGTVIINYQMTHT